ncbi:MAG: nucleotidyltransferase family protein [Bacteroidales bacterium]|jgi:dTDP-glucose pyrophosphorylase|nr:nucleotidyltransferase family protein [Bacteroidales bacterium]
MNEKVKTICINKNASLSLALKKMDEVQRKILILIDEDNTFFSLISIGDIQRSIINNLPLTTSVSDVVRKDVTVASPTENIDRVKERMKIRHNELMPIIDTNNRIIDVIFWEDLFEDKIKKENINLPVVIMAGGQGSRLKPLTNILPKPLIPIKDKTIIEDIMDRFVEYGCNRFYVSVNFKADLIRYYFDSLKTNTYDIHFFQEDTPLGTGGSLSLLKGKLNQTFFVSNCDIIIDQDYNEIINYHYKNKNEITIVAAIKNYQLPYGSLSTVEDGLLDTIEEKPEYTFKINTGFYILEPHLLNEIPDDTFYHITNLIEKLRYENRRVGVFPVNTGSWIDIGNWKEYLGQINTIND